MIKIFTLATLLTGAAFSAHAETPASRYPWMVKSQTELTSSECNAAMQHDSNYLWSRGKCHMKFIRYAAGVAINDAPADEDSSSIIKKGDIFRGITQYRSIEGLYCAHGDYCYPAKAIKLLGSVITGPYGGAYASGEDDGYKAVATTCELLLADRDNLNRYGALQLLEGCR